MAASMGTGEGSLGHPIRSGQASAKKRVGDWVATLLQPKKNRQSYSLHRDFQALERDQRVTTILNSGAFRSELEGILQGQLEGRRQPQQPSKAIQQLQENVVPPPPGPGPRIVGAGLAAKAVIPINDLRGVRASKYAMFERQKRCKLAAVYRLADMFGWGALILNHFSARLTSEGKRFLVNPHGLMCTEITASTLVTVNLSGRVTDAGSTRLGFNRMAFALHSAVYRAQPKVQCIIHVHSTASTAVSCMNCGLLSLSREAALLGDVSYHEMRSSEWGEEEKRQLAHNLGDSSKVLVLRNHGLLAMGSTVEEAFYTAFNAAKACEIQVSAMPAGLANLTHITNMGGVWRYMTKESITGRSKGIGSPTSWKRGELEFEALMRMLDSQGYNTGYRYRSLGLLEPPRTLTGDSIDEKDDKDNPETPNLNTTHETTDYRNPWEFLDSSASDVKPMPETHSKRDPWDFLGSPKGHKKRQRSNGQAKAGHESSDDDAPARRMFRKKPSSTLTANHHQSPKNKAWSSQPQERPEGLESTRVQDPDHQLTSLERAEHTAKQVAWSTGKAVQQLAAKELLDHHGSLGAQGTLTSNGIDSGEAKVNERTAPRTCDDTPTEVAEHHQIVTQTPLSSVANSPEYQVTPTTGFIHKPVLITFPDGCSPAEKAAYTAEMVADSTSAAVQKLSTSLGDTSNNQISSSGYSGKV